MSQSVPLWRIISLVMGLIAFLGVGGVSLTNGENLMWSAIKSVGSFVACWIVMGYLGHILEGILAKQSDE
jgi:hypothetical protein